MTAEELLQAHIELSQTLRDTHYGHQLRVLTEAPTPVEFAKAVGNGTPLLIKGTCELQARQALPDSPEAAKTWPALTHHKWTNDYLLTKLGDRLVTASLTGDGYADAVRWLLHSPSHTRNRDDECAPLGAYHFVTPYDIQIPFAALLDHMIHGGSQISNDVHSVQRLDRSQHEDPPESKIIAYCQLQNDCLRGEEYMELLQDVPQVVPFWAAAVLGKEPDVVNFWMGTNKSITTIHSDPYENIYTVIRGTKLFTLYPPCDAFFLNRTQFPTATWIADRTPPSSLLPSLSLVPTTSLPLDVAKQPSHVPWIPDVHSDRSISPLCPNFKFAPSPFIARVHAGDSLYLPKGWFHRVEQEEDEGKVCIAVNAWYDGFEGMGQSWGWQEYAERMKTIWQSQKK